MASADLENDDKAREGEMVDASKGYRIPVIDGSKKESTNEGAQPAKEVEEQAREEDVSAADTEKNELPGEIEEELEVTEPEATEAIDAASSGEAPGEETKQADGEAETSDEEKASEAEEPPPETPRPRQPTYVETLERRLQEAQDQLREYIQAYKKVKEEAEEVKARLEREAEKELETLRGKVVSQLFDVMDNLDRSIGAAEADWNAESFMQGIKMVQGQFLEKLQGLGLEVIAPLGHKFDPTEAEAMMLMPTSDPEQDEKVVQVFVRGFRLKDRVIRPAMVGVARFVDES